MSTPGEFTGPLYALLRELVEDRIAHLVNLSSTAARNKSLTEQEALCAFHTISHLRSLVTDLESKARKALL